jgi:polar amino acid transport system substrate-binding protein
MLRTAFILACICLLVGHPARAEALRACGGESNWPPMSYVQQGDKEVKGLSPDILRSVLTPQPVIALRPWARCLYEVESHRDFDIVMSVLRNPEREKIFLFSRSYLSLTPSYLYATARYAYPPVHSLADLGRFRVCALHGASTSYTRMEPSAIDSGAPNYDSLIKKVDRGYCDIVVDMREVFQGFSNLGLLPFDSKQYRILPLPETEKYPLHFGVSRKHPQAQALIEEIDRGLLGLEKSGKLARIVATYLAPQ